MGDESSGLTPVDQSKLSLSSAKVTAAGIPAVISSAVHSMKKMGVGKTVKTLRIGQVLNSVKTVLRRLLMRP